MNFGKNLLDWVQTNALSLASVIVIIFGIKSWFSNEKGKVIGSVIILMVCVFLIADPTTFITAAKLIMKKIVGGA